MKRLLQFLFLLPILFCVTPAHAAKVQGCTGGAVGTSVACVMGSNVTTGHLIHFYGGALSAATTISVSGCAPVSSFIAPDVSLVDGNLTTRQWYGFTTSTAACTITFSSTASVALNVMGEEYNDAVTTLDGHAQAAAGGSLGARTTPAITTIANGELIIASIMNRSNSSGCTYTAGAGFLLVNNNTATNCSGKETQTQVSAGSITPPITVSATADAYSAATISFSGAATTKSRALLGVGQ